MKIEQLKISLKDSLLGKYKENEDFIKESSNHDHDHDDEKTKEVREGMEKGIAAAAFIPPVPSPVPCLWPLVGCLVGALVGLVKLLYHEVERNNEINNAIHVHDYLGNEYKTILNEAAEKAINARIDKLSSISPDEKENIVKYLSENIMEAIKHDLGSVEGKDNKIDKILCGLQSPRSTEVQSQDLRDEHGKFVCSLRALAYNRVNVSSSGQNFYADAERSRERSAEIGASDSKSMPTPRS